VTELVFYSATLSVLHKKCLNLITSRISFAWNSLKISQLKLPSYAADKKKLDYCRKHSRSSHLHQS